ncbi:N5-glutamine methyltransferase family protein [Paenibacillus solisilvae]|uniref:Release factor glutamine methyltransferase n=1 Tax=Paenibacillus solisilvae TaxID=2486751 RepID=A0ABW0VS38_9BACL
MPISIGEACLQASLFLEAQGVGEPRANAELLLMHQLGLSRAELLRDLRDPFPQGQMEAWAALMERKAAGEPVQYIIGEQWFYGLSFAVTPAVLVPRPETELLVEAVLEAADRLWPEAAGGEAVSGEAVSGEAVSGEAVSGEAVSGEAVSGEAAGGDAASGDTVDREAVLVSDGPTVVDVGTGSGAIGVTLAALRPRWRVCASDLSPDALAVARSNAARHDAAERMAFVQGDLLGPFAVPRPEEDAAAGNLAGLRIDVLVSNPPYIPASDIPGLQPEVRDYEPRLALDGGDDGLTPYRRMMEQLPLLAVLPRIVAFELGQGQADAVAAMLREYGAWSEVRIITDYAGIDRHVLAVLS